MGRSITLHLAVLKTIFDFILAPPPHSPGGFRVNVRAVSFLRKSGIWADSGPDPGGYLVFNFDFGPKRS